ATARPYEAGTRRPSLDGRPVRDALIAMVPATTRAAWLLLLATPACQLVLPIERDDRDYRTEVIADAPLIYLRFGEARGWTAVDEMGTYNGAYPDAGITFGAEGAISGDTNAAVRFDGTAGIQMPPSVDFAGTSPFTVELWAKQNQVDGIAFAVDHED